jgi:hypothetical protein
MNEYQNQIEKTHVQTKVWYRLETVVFLACTVNVENDDLVSKERLHIWTRFNIHSLIIQMELKSGMMN